VAARGPGRQPSPRAVWSFERPGLFPPDALVLDTTFVVQVLVATEPHHSSASSWMEDLADADALLVFNRLLELELREVAFRIPLIERFGGRDWRRRRHDGRSLRRARRLTTQTMDAWTDLLRAYDYARVELHQVMDLVPQYMNHYGLSSYDAVHAATAQFVAVDAMATTDVGFASVPARTPQRSRSTPSTTCGCRTAASYERGSTCRTHSPMTCV
jgi:predicted nucleic acid-binding protein